MMASHGPNDRTEGFALVEMLVAISLIAILSGLLLVSLSQIRPLMAATKAVETETELAAIAGYIERVVAGARRLPLLDENIDRKRVFSGDTSGVRFVSVLRIASNASSLREVEIFIRQNGRGGIDLFQRNTVRRLGPEKRREEFVIARDLASVRFRYLEPSQGSGDPVWRDDWPDGSRLPRAVRVHLVLKRPGREATEERFIYLRTAG